MPESIAPERPPDDPAAFAYSTLPASCRERVRAVAERVRAVAYRTAREMIGVGRLLGEVRGLLKKRTFRRWLAAEFPWSRSHCYRLIAVADTFGPLVPAEDDRACDRIEPTALYLLARPEVPEGARSLAVAISADRRVTAGDAREILAAARPAASPDPDRGEVSALVPLRGPDRKPRATPPPESLADPAAAWAALEGLAARSRVVHIGNVAEEDGEDAPLYSVTVYSDDDGPRNKVRRTLADAVMAAAGREPEKLCLACAATKPVGEFGLVGGNGDGRNRYCKICERKRQAKVKAEKKKRKGKAGPPPAAKDERGRRGEPPVTGGRGKRGDGDD